MANPNRKPTNLSLDAALLAQARAIDVNISRAAEDGLRAAVKKELEARWRAENAEAIAGFNQYVEENGLPLEEYRMF